MMNVNDGNDDYNVNCNNNNDNNIIIMVFLSTISPECTYPFD